MRPSGIIALSAVRLREPVEPALLPVLLSPLFLVAHTNESFPRAIDSFTSANESFEYVNDACTRARRVTCPQSTSLFMHAIESNTVVCVASTVELQLTSIQLHNILPVCTISLNRAESITASATPGGYPPPLQNRLWYCGVKSFRGVCARPRASRRLMSHSPNVISPAPAPPPAGPAATPVPPHHTAHWLHRADLFLRVIVRLYIGLILVFLPWTRVWALNRFFLYYAHVSRLMESGAVRGLVSGLGLLNLWIAISEAIHYKES